MVTVSTNMAGRGTDIILGGNYSQMAQLGLRGLLSEGLLSLEEQAKVPVVDDDFYPAEVPEDLEEKLITAVGAVAESERGKEVKTFLDLEELVAQLAGEAPFEQGPSFEALV